MQGTNSNALLAVNSVLLAFPYALPGVLPLVTPVWPSYSVVLPLL